MIGKQLMPIAFPQIQILMVQRPCGTYNNTIFERKYYDTPISSVLGDLDIYIVRRSRDIVHSDDFEGQQAKQSKPKPSKAKPSQQESIN